MVHQRISDKLGSSRVNNKDFRERGLKIEECKQFIAESKHDWSFTTCIWNPRASHADVVFDSRVNLSLHECHFYSLSSKRGDLLLLSKVRKSLWEIKWRTWQLILSVSREEETFIKS